MILKLIEMDARGNKLSSCKIPDQYLKKQISYYTFRTLYTKMAIQLSCYHNLKMLCSHCPGGIVGLWNNFF